MNKTILLLCFFYISISHSQKSSNQFELSASAGVSSPSSAYSDDSFASDGSYFELTPSYSFSNFGIGASFGQFTNLTEDKLSEFTDPLAFSTSNSSDNWKSIYYGIGPEYNFSFGKVSLKLLTRIGGMTIQENNLEVALDGENLPNPIVVYSVSSDGDTSTSYFSGGIKLGFSLSQNLSLFVNSNYLSTLSESLVISEGRMPVQDLNKNGIVDAEDFINRDGTVIQMATTTKNVKPETLNYGAGFTYTFQKSKVRKPMQDIKSNSQDQQNTGLLDFQKPDKVEQTSAMNKGEIINEISNDTGSSKDKNYKVKGSVSFTNPAKEKADKRKSQRRIITSSPKNNEQFKKESNLKFNWNLIGEPIMQPKYSIEISKVGRSQTNEWVLIGQASKNKLSLKDLFDQNSHNTRVAERLRHKDRAVFTEGQYRWRVTEITTGTASNYSFFNFTNCEIDFSISNEEIECLGYEGEDRKFKICFDSTYLSSSGDLTFINASSGLTVYDQTYTPLTYTLVSPNPTLLTQIGAIASTVSYCFEVTVSSSVTSIGFGLQGDDLDPSPILCQPGVSAMIDELPDCLCDDCENIELSFDDFSIALNGASGNQFNFNGSINVNVPIYGIEFQVQSYSYSASPSACTDGVTSVEESGMILMPGTTINGSTSLELANESVSGSASSNNNATKNIKYTTTSPLTGPIPVNLTIGLPGPLSGLDPSCCTIDYTVCIKVKVFYEDGNCKSCVFTHCFEFNNQ